MALSIKSTKPLALCAKGCLTRLCRYGRKSYSVGKKSSGKAELVRKRYPQAVQKLQRRISRSYTPEVMASLQPKNQEPFGKHFDNLYDFTRSNVFTIKEYQRKAEASYSDTIGVFDPNREDVAGLGSPGTSREYSTMSGYTQRRSYSLDSRTTGPDEKTKTVLDEWTTSSSKQEGVRIDNIYFSHLAGSDGELKDAAVEMLEEEMKDGKPAKPKGGQKRPGVDSDTKNVLTEWNNSGQKNVRMDNILYKIMVDKNKSGSSEQ